MKKLSVISLLLLIFLGCSNTKVSVKDSLKNEGLAYTTKTQIITPKSRYLIVGTYLNPIIKLKPTDDEKFIIFINPKDATISHESIRVNGDSFGVKVKELDEDNKVVKNLGFTLPWSKYYEISSPCKKGDELSLTFEIYPSKMVKLDFVKVAKSLYWNQ